MAAQYEFNNIAFLDHFSQIDDPRINRKKLYPLNEILLVTLCGVICGAESWRDLEKFGNLKLDFLRKYLPYKNGIPSHDTFGRLYSLLDPKSFGDCFISWVEDLMDEIPKLISIDGKTLRRSFDKAGCKLPIHLVSAFASEARMVLGQVKVDDKTNEITAIPALLDLLDMKGAIITIDAMGCQKEITAIIRKKNADYVLALKKNHKGLHEQVETFFKLEGENNFKDILCDFHKEIDKGHGRIEIRECWTTEDISWIEGVKKWEGIKSIAMIRATRIIDQKETTETRLFISSLPADASLIARSVRSHWSIENALHWTLDVTMNEDGSRIRSKNAPENMAIIRKVALNKLQLARTKDVSIKGLRKAAGWDNATLEHVLIQKL